MGKLNVNYMYEQQIRKKGFKKAYVFTMELCSPVSYLKMSKELSDFIYEQHIYTIQNFMDWCEMLTREQMLKLSSEKITKQTLNLYEKINKGIENNRPAEIAHHIKQKIQKINKRVSKLVVSFIATINSIKKLINRNMREVIISYARKYIKVPEYLIREISFK